jgi:hypothetical protein
MLLRACLAILVSLTPPQAHHTRTHSAAIAAASEVAGDVWLGPAVEGSQPLYLLPNRDLDLAGFSLGLGIGDLTITFTSAGAPPPTIVDNGLPGILAAAWLNGLTLEAQQPLFLGYVEAGAGSPQLFGAVGNQRADGKPVVFRLLASR